MLDFFKRAETIVKKIAERELSQYEVEAKVRADIVLRYGPEFFELFSDRVHEKTGPWHLSAFAYGYVPKTNTSCTLCDCSGFGDTPELALENVVSAALTSIPGMVKSWSETGFDKNKRRTS